MPSHPVTACALIIGNEILSGRTQETNLVFLGRRLNELGIRLSEARVVPDLEDAIVAAVNDVRSRHAYVFTTGGIGPTHDDISAASVAKAFGLPLVEHPRARAILEAYYGPGELNAARLRMARAPEGARLIDNPISKAPGFQIGNVFVLAGIPAVMQVMFEGVVDRLVGGKPLISRSVTVDLPEGVLAQDLAALQARDEAVEIGSYPFNRHGTFGTRLVLRSTEPERLSNATRALDELIARLGGAGVWDQA